MAADSGCFQDGIFVGVTRKIKRLSDGSLFAAAGPRPLIQECERWVNEGCPADGRPKPEEEKQFGGIWLKTDSSIWRISYKFDVYDDPAPFAVEGMGLNFMFGAMAFGASAQEAVELALRYVDGARGDIQVERV